MEWGGRGNTLTSQICAVLVPEILDHRAGVVEDASMMAGHTRCIDPYAGRCLGDWLSFSWISYRGDVEFAALLPGERHPLRRDRGRHLMSSFELAVGDVVAAVLQCRNDNAAAPIDGENAIGGAV